MCFLERCIPQLSRSRCRKYTVRYCSSLDDVNAENVQSRLMFNAFCASSFSRNTNNGMQAMTWSRRFAVVLSSRRLGFDLEAAYVGTVMDKPARRYALFSVLLTLLHIHSFIHLSRTVFNLNSCLSATPTILLRRKSRKE
jgi:hypothetical protein